MLYLGCTVLPGCRGVPECTITDSGVDRIKPEATPILGRPDYQCDASRTPLEDKGK